MKIQMNFFCKTFIITLKAIFIFATFTYAQNHKSIYIPKDLRNMDFNNSESQWSYERMDTTDNFVVFWEKGFGKDLSKAPELDGHNMTVDLNNLKYRLESYYTYFRDSLNFVLPKSKSERYRMMVMIRYSLEGTAYGGDYDGEIGALWVTPNRLQDKKLNCIAHELGHSFQAQVSCDGQGEAWGGHGFFEMTSQWMLWNVNPEWTTDENYHWQDFKKKFHLHFLHGSNIYHSPYVLEYWCMKHGKTAIADLYRHGRKGEDPAMTYMRIFNVDLKQMGDEMYECYARLQTFDYPRIKDTHKKFAGEMRSEILTQPNKKDYFTPNTPNIPGEYGFNVIDIEVPMKRGKLSVNFEGLGDKKKDSYRYGLIAIDQHGNAQYGKMSSAFKGKVCINTDINTKLVKMVVVGCPNDEYTPKNMNTQSQRTYNYQIQVQK